MDRQHFGLRHAPLGKALTEPWDDGAVANLKQRFNGVLQSPGLGRLTGEPGVGKTAALRSITRALNPHGYRVLYQAETDFGRIDLYRGLARAPDHSLVDHRRGAEPAARVLPRLPRVPELRRKRSANPTLAPVMTAC